MLPCCFVRDRASGETFYFVYEAYTDSCALIAKDWTCTRRISHGELKRMERVDGWPAA